MLKKLRNKRGQNTAEYAILIALVVGGIIAMQTYAQRTLQGRMRDASITMRDKTSNVEGISPELQWGKTLQYEPYYTNTKADTYRNSETIQETAAGVGTSNATSNVVVSGQLERTEYNAPSDGNE